MAKLIVEDETEVPPPPGTEPLLPIPALGNSPDKNLEHVASKVEEKKEQDDDYSDDQRPRERRRSFTKDSHRERYKNIFKYLKTKKYVSVFHKYSDRYKMDSCLLYKFSLGMFLFLTSKKCLKFSLSILINTDA